MLQFDNVTLRRGPRVLFQGASFQIHPGQKTGLTGANGSGKSSLFALVLGTLTADEGAVRHPAGWVIAHVAQESPHGEGSAIDYVMDSDRELRKIQVAIAENLMEQDPVYRAWQTSMPPCAAWPGSPFWPNTCRSLRTCFSGWSNPM